MTGSQPNCASCGQENPADYKFCARCGNQLLLQQSAAADYALGGPSRGSTAQATVQPATTTQAPRTNCPFCGEEILATARKCKHCGEFVQLPGSTGAPFSGAMKELKPYYQEEFRKIQESGEGYRGKWNWAAFFWGGFWALSKGLWKSGLVSIVGAALTAGLVLVIYWFIFGARGNYMYYRKVVKREEPWI